MGKNKEGRSEGGKRSRWTGSERREEEKVLKRVRKEEVKKERRAGRR